MRIRSNGDSPSPSSDRENISMIPFPADENYNSQPTLERSSMDRSGMERSMERSGSSNLHNMQLSSPTDTVNTVIHNPEDGASNYSSLEVRSSSHRSVGNFEPLIRPEEPLSPPPQDIHDDEIHIDRNSESQKLMGHPADEKSTHINSRSNTAKTKSGPARADSYNPGSCCYCLSNISCTNIFLWISLVIVLIGWSVSIWRSVNSMDVMSYMKLRTGYSVNGFPFTDITIIVISTTTLLFSIVFLIISSYTSESLSSYHLESSHMNKCAYCFTIAMSVFSCIAVILWTLIVAVTMIPTTIVSIIHFLFSSGSVNCVHLPSYGLKAPIVVGVGEDQQAPVQLHCDDDLEIWLAQSWNLMTPLLISLGCAIFIEIILMGFIMVISSNGRHLYERMGYLMSSKSIRHDKLDSERQQHPFI